MDIFKVLGANIPVLLTFDLGKVLRINGKKNITEITKNLK